MSNLVLCPICNGGKTREVMLDDTISQEARGRKLHTTRGGGRYVEVTCCLTGYVQPMTTKRVDLSDFDEQ